MFARLQPSKGTITEAHQFSHEIGSRQRIDHVSSTGEITLDFDYDARKCCELVPRQDANPAGQSPDKSVTVGFISIDNAPTAQPIVLTPDNALDSLARVDVYHKVYTYPLEQPASLSLRIDPKIIDDTRHEDTAFFEAHEFADGLAMGIRVTVSIPVPKLRAPASLHRHLQQILNGQLQVNCIQVQPQCYRDRVRLASYLSALANGGGGILLFGMSGPQIIGGIEEAEIAELSALTESTALTLEPPLAISPPRHFVIDEKNLLIVEVPTSVVQSVVTRTSFFQAAGQAYVLTQLPPWSLPRKTSPGDHAAYDPRGPGAPARLVRDEVEREVKKGPAADRCFLAKDISGLSDIQAAIANAGGGRIFFGVHSQGVGRPGEVVGCTTPTEWLEVHSHPWARREHPYIVNIHDKNVVIHDILAQPPDLYRGSTGFCTFDGSAPNRLEDPVAMRLLRDRKGHPTSVLPKPEPLLRRLSLKWFAFPSTPDIYNPENACIEWRDVPFKAEREREGAFVCSLQAPITRAKELLDRKSLTGEIDVEIGDVLLGSVPIRTYDATGLQSTPEWQIRTRLTSNLRISLDPILQRRSYYPTRSTTVLGVEPRPERLGEIIRVLNDSGIMVKDHAVQYGSIVDGVRLRGEKEGAVGATFIVCDVSGTPSLLTRRLTHDQQTDDKQLTSGSISLVFRAFTEEPHEIVVALLNDVISNVHRRFDYLRVE